MRRSILTNKKGDATSLIISLIIVVFVLALISIPFSKIFIEVLDQLEEQPEFSNNSISTMQNVEDKTIPFLDYLIMFSFVSIMIGLIISSIYIDTHPALFVVFIVVLIFAITLSGVFANVINEVGSDPQLSSTYDQFTYTGLMIEHFPILIFVVGLIVAIVLYGKSKSGGQPQF
jgi:hypothetical protein